MIDPSQVDMVTYSGKIVSFPNPTLTKIDLVDIRYATSNICRYGGHAKWELVRHLALCTLLNDYHYERVGLCEGINGEIKARHRVLCATHDFSEVYLGDVVSGLKRLLPAYKAIEAIWEKYIWESLLKKTYPNNEYPETGLDGWVKYIDNVALVTEMVGLNHPGAYFAEQRLGKAEQANLEFFQVVKDLTTDECWEHIEIAIKEYKNG